MTEDLACDSLDENNWLVLNTAPGYFSYVLKPARALLSTSPCISTRISEQLSLPSLMNCSAALMPLFLSLLKKTRSQKMPCSSRIPPYSSIQSQP